MKLLVCPQDRSSRRLGNERASNHNSSVMRIRRVGARGADTELGSAASCPILAMQGIGSYGCLQQKMYTIGGGDVTSRHSNVGDRSGLFAGTAAGWICTRYAVALLVDLVVHLMGWS